MVASIANKYCYHMFIKPYIYKSCNQIRNQKIIKGTMYTNLLDQLGLYDFCSKKNLKLLDLSS